MGNRTGKVSPSDDVKTPPETDELLAISMEDSSVKLVRHEQLPNWLKDNEFLLEGHRSPTNSYWMCLKSILEVHTETGNIWTHLIGLIEFIAVSIFYLSLPDIPWTEKLVFSTFFAGALATFGCSTGFHTFHCHSEPSMLLFIKLDYCGIVIGLVGSYIPWIYFCFYCSFVLKIVYTLVILSLGIACFVVSMLDKFAEPKYRPIRAGLFIGFGISGAVPLTHFLINDGIWNALQTSGIGWLFVVAIFYIMGAAIYALRIPERFCPGRFDLLFNSHQILHVFVFLAVAVDLHGIMRISEYRGNNGRCGCDVVENACVLDNITRERTKFARTETKMI